MSWRYCVIVGVAVFAYMQVAMLYNKSGSVAFGRTAPTQVSQPGYGGETAEEASEKTKETAEEASEKQKETAEEGEEKTEKEKAAELYLESSQSESVNEAAE